MEFPGKVRTFKLNHQPSFSYLFVKQTIIENLFQQSLFLNRMPNEPT